MSTDLPGLGSNRMQAMVYGYDQLHRIVQARSLSEYGSNGYAEKAPGANKYDVDYSYDANGNLLTLNRLDGNTSLRDDLTYEYNDGTNRLRNTNPNEGENYTYDKVGNLISDAEEGIDSIAWTPYGKVRADIPAEPAILAILFPCGIIPKANFRILILNLFLKHQVTRTIP